MNGPGSNGVDSGYVLLKRQDDGQMVTVQSQNAPPTNGNIIQQQSQSQPQSLPTIQQSQAPYPSTGHVGQENDRKYFRLVDTIDNKLYISIE